VNEKRLPTSQTKFMSTGYTLVHHMRKCKKSDHLSHFYKITEVIGNNMYEERKTTQHQNKF